MSEFPVPSCFRGLPITSTALATRITDSLLPTHDRHQDSLLLLICDRHARPLQPVVLPGASWDADERSRQRTFDFLTSFMDVKVLVAMASGGSLEHTTIHGWQEAASQQLGDRLIHFLVATPAEIHDAAPLSVAGAHH